MKSAIRTPVDPCHGLAAGQIHRVEFPFTSSLGDDIVDGELCKVKFWKPGVRFEDVRGRGDPESFADGVGTMVIEIVSLHRPSSRHPMMVFYRRSWEYPDGTTAKTRGLKIKSASALRRIVSGYRYPFKVVEAEANESEVRS